MKRFLFLCLIALALCFWGCGEDTSENDRSAVTDAVGTDRGDTEIIKEPELPIYTELVTEFITEPVTEAVTVPAIDSVTEGPASSETEPSGQASNTAVEYDEYGYAPTVLMYHLILDIPYSSETALFVRPSEFEDHLAVMNDVGYRYLFANDYNRTKEKSVMITFDDGYEDNYTNMFPILKKYGARATVFLITDLIDTPGYLTSEQIKEMSDSGHVMFGCHTESHTMLTTLSDADIREELEGSIAKIEAITGQECDILAYPSGDHDVRVCEIVSEYITYAYLAKPRRAIDGHYYLTIPRIYAPRGFDGEQMLARIEGRA